MDAITRDLRYAVRSLARPAALVSWRLDAVSAPMLVFAVAMTACTTLLYGAGLMVQSFRHLRFEQLGFDPAEVVVVDVSLDRFCVHSHIAK